MRGVTENIYKVEVWIWEFQLTRLMRGVTSQLRLRFTVTEFQLTRLMRGVTGPPRYTCNGIHISTHTPHARRDSIITSRECARSEFQLTRLMRGVTARLTSCQTAWHFNSHASCEA